MKSKAVRRRRECIQTEYRRHKRQIQRLRARMDKLQDRCKHPRLIRMEFRYNDNSEKLCPDCGFHTFS